MVAIAPLAGQVVRPEVASDVISPAYDALTTEQRRAYRAAHPHCYLHVTRSAVDEDDAATVDDATLVARGRAALERLVAADLFAPAQRPQWLAYELEALGHVQRGLVCEVRGREFRDRARPHEATQPDRAALLAAHFTTVGAASSPVACTLRRGDPLAQALAAPDDNDLVLEHDDGRGLIQRVWTLPDDRGPAVEAAMSGEDLYIIDGHHRAAANRLLLERGIELPLLVAVFPPASLQLVGFHRLVRLPADFDEHTLLQRVRRRFSTTTVASPTPPARGSVLVQLDGAWHRVEFDERPVAGGARVRLGSLDPCIVEREIIGPIGGPTGAVDVAYLPDQDSIERVAAEARRAGRFPIVVPPLEVADMVEVADGGLIMPPKSTYFTPKVRSGVFLRRFDDLIA